MEANVNAPAMPLRTNRGLAKVFFLSLITFGIYFLALVCSRITHLRRTVCLYPQTDESDEPDQR